MVHSSGTDKQGYFKLTHIQLSYKAGHVIVLKKLWKDFLGEALFIQYQETVALL